MKSAEEIMKILDAYDLTGSLRDAGELAGCSHHTVKRYVERRAVAGDAELGGAAGRPQLIDEYLDKVEEWVERSQGKVRADKAHEKLLALGYTGSERTTRRAVARVKKSYRAGNVRVHRPWVTDGELGRDGAGRLRSWARRATLEDGSAASPTHRPAPTSGPWRNW